MGREGCTHQVFDMPGPVFVGSISRRMNAQPPPSPEEEEEGKEAMILFFISH